MANMHDGKQDANHKGMVTLFSSRARAGYPLATTLCTPILTKHTAKTC